MAHVLLLIAGLLVAGLYPSGWEPLWFFPWLTASATAALTLVYPLLGWGLVALLWRGFERKGWSVDRFQARLHAGFVAYRVLLVVQFAFELFILHWPLLVERVLGSVRVPLLGDVAGLLPFLAALVLSWIPSWMLDRRIRGSATWSLREYLAFQLRSSLGLFLLPVFCCLGLSETLDAVPGVSYLLTVYPFVAWLGMLGALFLMYLCSPLLLRAVLRTTSLPAGSLRERLDAVARRAGFRYSDLRVWKTGGGQVLNALIVGLTGRLRYVLLTDALVEKLTPEELEAVFGHEIGHSRHHHLSVYFAFVIGGSFLLGSLEVFASEFLGFGPAVISWTLAPPVLAAGAWMFGHLSRRFERQADIFGATLAVNPERFVTALRKVADQNGMPRSVGSWRYFSIDQRCADVWRAVLNPEIEARYLAGLRRVLAVVAVTVALGCGGVAATAWLQYGKREEYQQRYRALVAADEGKTALDGGRAEEAERLLSEALDGLPKNPVVYQWLADAVRKQGRKQEALKLYREAKALECPFPDVRMALKAAIEELEAEGEGG
ncbi:MAG: M48 family metalloprotease [Planctomycetes bacterium]|nr:M48 family metalloprotease [Planctomycetota bacterium]